MNSWGQNPALVSGISSGEKGNWCRTCRHCESWQRASRLTHLAWGGEFFILSQGKLHEPPGSPCCGKAARPQVDAAEDRQYQTQNHCNLSILRVLGLLLCWSLDPACKDGWMMDREKPRQRLRPLRAGATPRKAEHIAYSEKWKYKRCFLTVGYWKKKKEDPLPTQQQNWHWLH